MKNEEIILQIVEQTNKNPFGEKLIIDCGQIKGSVIIEMSQGESSILIKEEDLNADKEILRDRAFGSLLKIILENAFKWNVQLLTL